VRGERLPAGTDLHERLGLAHANYARQEWTVSELHPGQWAFVAQKGERRLLIAIRALETTIAGKPNTVSRLSEHLKGSSEYRWRQS